MKFRNLANKYYAAPMVAAPLTLAVAFPSFAEGGTVVSASDWASVITSLTNQVSVSTIVGVLATTVAAGIGLVFMWWGLRKAVRTIMAAFRKGKLSV